MKIYLQNCKTLKFLRCDSSWSTDLAEALDFISIRRATIYGLTELKDAFQLMQFQDDGFHSRLPAISQLPLVNIVTFLRPARVARRLCTTREIFRRIRSPQNIRLTGQLLPAMQPSLMAAA